MAPEKIGDRSFPCDPIDAEDPLTFSSTNGRPPLQPPPPIPDHELVHRIGCGTYGQVWLARNLLGTLRAVKTVFRQRFEGKDIFDQEFNGLQNFEPISRTHEGLVDILQVGRTEDCLYYVMELADDANAEARGQNAEAASEDGQAYFPRTLRSDLARHQRLPAEQCINIGLKLTSALAHLHQHGLVHRDVKPSNIIFVNDEPKLADVGLVTETSEAHSIVGTVGYIPLEGPGSPQADLFALGKVLYEISTGQNRQEFPQLPPEAYSFADAEALSELNEIVLKACDDNPKARYSSAEKMCQHLLRLQRGQSVRQTLRLEKLWSLAKRAAAIAIVPAILVLAAYIFGQTISKNRQPPKNLTSLFQALELAADHPERAKDHRDQIASVLQQFPKPTGLALDITGGPSLRFSQDNATVLALCGSQMVDVYSRQFGRHLFTLEHRSPVFSANFSPDGDQIFTVSSLGQGYLWQSDSGQVIPMPEFRDILSSPLDQWQKSFRNQADANKFTFTPSQGTLRIQVESPTPATKGMVLLRPPATSVEYSDLTMSLDILDWDKILPGQTIGIAARVSGWSQQVYFGLITFNDPVFDGRASLTISKGSTLRKEPVDIVPAKAYRLAFSVVRGDLLLNLIELAPPMAAVASLKVSDYPTVDPGKAGIWVNANWGKSAYDITVSNLQLTGTHP